MSKIQREAVSYESVKRLSISGIKKQSSFGPEKTDIFFKRSFDLLVSLLVIVFVLSWLIPILAVLIKIGSRGPVFFVQERVGAFGKVFHCYKLRTMYVNKEAHLQQAQENDPRITRFGNFLRLSCLDEVPQFFNVLLGQMSVVGPRPHMIRDCREFSKIVKDYHDREKVKPGITGMAQVKGYRGKTTNLYDVMHRYKLDMFYVKNCSFRLDMRIMKLTFVAMFTTVSSAFRNQPAGKENDSTIYSLDTPEYLN